MNLFTKSRILLGAFLAFLLVAFLSPALAIVGFAGLVAVHTVTRPFSCDLRVTLSVPELLMDVMDAFKTEIPFMLDAFTTDFSSKTAVKGDVITAHISSLPAVQDYDATTGFDNNVADADSLIVDVPVTLSIFKHVPIRVKWLTQLASKMPLYKEAIRNYGYVLAKSVVDAVLAQITAANFSHSDTVAPANVVLETMEAARTQLTTQKAFNRGRFGIVNSAFAGALQNDGRVQSSLFYGMLNGDQAYRVFRNLSGFQNIWEYPDMPTTGNLEAFFGDKRSFVVANRRVDFSNAAEELGVAKIMQFYPMADPSTGLEMTGVAWQKQGTGDVIVSAAVLYGVAGGSQGGAADAITDKAGYWLKSA
jgi:hypothetical protein